MNKDIGILDPKGQNNNPLTDKPYSETYRNLAKVWSNFPAYQNVEKIINDIRSNNVILVVSGTGSGKTVLFPKYVLHALNYNAKIAITLPKQEVTKRAALFSAETMDVILGEEVGYQYRNSPKDASSSKTKLLYCTDGTLVARLLTDPLIKDFDSVIIDEAHERKVNIDFLLYLLRNVLRQRPEFKLIIMSATINQQIFNDYYKEFNYVDLSIGTKPNYPIKSIYLDKDLDINKNEYLDQGFELIKKLMKEKNDYAILFFVTSITETNNICEKLINDDISFKDNNICVPFFSGMHEDQVKIATDKDYYRGFINNGRKILIATNAAESSITIEGIGYVIDSGLELRSRFDPVNRINILEKIMITQAQAKQRMGRTGRTAPGTCYHLYTEKMFKDTMEKFPAPAISIESISNEIIRMMGYEKKTIEDKTPKTSVKEIRDMISEFIEPPREKFLDAEFKYLKQINIIDSDNDNGTLTDLGLKISQLQIEPEQGTGLIMAYRLNCFREVAAIYATIDAIKGSIDGFFIVPTNDPLETSDVDDKKKFSKQLTIKFEKSRHDFDNMYGDHLAILKIFKDYEELRQSKNTEKLVSWAYKYFLKRDVLEKAYQGYMRFKNRYRYRISQMNYQKPDQQILSIELKYRIMASLLYGSSLNILISKDDNLQTLNGNVTNIRIDQSSFYNPDKSSDMFYYQLFKFHNSPLKAKIVSKISKKSLDIIKKLDN